jgi:hypothetical protein
LYVLILTQGEAAAPQDLSKALRRTFAIAAADGVSSLVVPCIGTNWEYNHSLSFDVFFGAFFEALPSGSVPRDVWLSLYAEWPTFHLEAAMASLNAHWEALFQAPQTVFYHRDSRLALVFLSLCLFVCSGQAPPTAKNVLIIATSFVASATAANSTVASLAQTYGETVAMVAQIAALAFLAVLFPLIVHWNPKDLFKAPNTDKPDTGSRQ